MVDTDCRSNLDVVGHDARMRLGVRIKGTLGDIDPLNKVPFKRATSRVPKGPL